MDIGGVHIPTPLALAPMAGVTDLAAVSYTHLEGSIQAITAGSPRISASAASSSPRKGRTRSRGVSRVSSMPSPALL